MEVETARESGEFWWVVEWILEQDVMKVTDRLIYAFLRDVEEDDFPAYIQARFFLRQLRSWSAKNFKGAEVPRAGDVPLQLLESLDRLASRSSDDAEYKGGIVTRKELGVPEKVWNQFYEKGGQSVLYDKDETKDQLAKYIKRAEAALGPCILKVRRRLGKDNNRTPLVSFHSPFFTFHHLFAANLLDAL